MDTSFKFQPISYSWVAVHPHPKGVIQFIGGAFFGTFPTVCYRYFLQTLFEEGYTIIALPFRFSFRHWSIAISLLQEQEVLGKELGILTKNPIYSEKSNYIWLGHSLGCKYIALLEFLSTNEWQKIIKSCTEEALYAKVETILNNANLENASILGQASLLLAPDISDTESAIPIRSFATFLDNIGWGVLPTRKQTQCFIANSNLFNLTSLISFDKDTIAGSITDEFKEPKIRESSDVLWLKKLLETKTFHLLHKELHGKHLEPLGIRIGNYIVDLNPFDKFIEPLKNRLLEHFATKFLLQLKREHPSFAVSKNTQAISPLR